MMDRRQANQLNKRLFLLAVCAMLWVSGCAAQSGQIEQSLVRLDKIEARVGTIETKIEQTNSQGQQGLINIASMGPGIGGYLLATLLMIVVWKFWRSRRYWKKAAAQTIGVIEEHKGYTHSGRRKLAKLYAGQTPFGRLVQCLTSASKNSSSTRSA